MENNLTTQDYWEDFYRHSPSNRKHIVTLGSRYDSFWDLLVSENPKGKSIIEIGGYPGRYLAYLADKYKVEPTSLDFNSDTPQIQKSFASMGISKYHLFEKDFNKYVPEKLYDCVYSLGFIEHFENYNEILDKHLDYLKPGGRLLVMVPNKKYFRKLYGYLVDYKNLKAHNLKCMNPKTFKDFGLRNNLTLLSVEYIGGFPYTVHQKLNFLQNLIYKSTRIIFKNLVNPYLEKHPSKYLSSGLVAIYEKPKVIKK